MEANPPWSIFFINNFMIDNVAIRHYNENNKH